MIIIGGEEAPVERLALTEENEDDVQAFYYAKNVTAATLAPSGEIRIPDSIPWPTPDVTPDDARGWWVYDANWDSRFVDIDYAQRKIKLKNVGKTQLTFTIENADGTTLDLVWDLDILDKLTPLSVSIDPSYDTTMHIGALWQVLGQVDGGDYPYTFRWFKDDVMVRERQTPQNDPADKTDYLTFQTLTWAEEAVYRIEAYDRHGSLAKSAAIRLTITPDAIVFSNAPETHRVREGQPWSESIDFTGGKPPFKFAWLRDGNATPYFAQSLTIPAVKPSDVGVWTLQVTDALGTVGVSQDGYTLYVIELLLTISPATNDANAVTTQYSPTRIGVVLDMADPALDYTFQLTATDYQTNTPETITDVEVVNGDATIVEVVPGTGGKVKLVPKWVRPLNFQIRTKDGRSDPVQIEANVVSLPHLSSPLTSPLLLTAQDGTPQTLQIIAPLKTPVGGAQESYRWQRKLPTDADWVDLPGVSPRQNFIAPTGRNESPVQYRLIVSNQYTGNKPMISNVVSLPFANLHEYDLLRTQYPNDPLIPGGVYTWGFVNAHNSGDPEAFNRGLRDPHTIPTWTIPTVNGVRFTGSSNRETMTATVAPTAAGLTNPATISITLRNRNGTPEVSNSQSNTFTVARPVFTAVSHNTYIGQEFKIANLSVPDAYGRIQPIAISVLGTGAFMTTRVDPLTGDIFATGVANVTDQALTVQLNYKAPGVDTLQTLTFLIKVSVSEMIRFRAGEGTAGDPLTYYK